jgi:hypothetical protein
VTRKVPPGSSDVAPKEFVPDERRIRATLLDMAAQNRCWGRTAARKMKFKVDREHRRTAWGVERGRRRPQAAYPVERAYKGRAWRARVKLYEVHGHPLSYAHDREIGAFVTGTKNDGIDNGKGFTKFQKSIEHQYGGRALGKS